VNEKLNFNIDEYDGFLKADLIGKSGKRIGHVTIWQNENLFTVVVYIYDKPLLVNEPLFELNDSCDNLYQALELANDWWNKFKRNYI